MHTPVDALAFPFPSLALRPVRASDDETINEIYYQTRRSEFVSLGWPEPMLRTLLRTQCAAQRSDWQNRFPHSSHHIVLLGENEIGRLWTDAQPERLHLIDISLLPPFQDRGIGTAMIIALRGLAAERNVPLSLSVFKGNDGALRLYRRLGGQVTGTVDGDTHWTMELPPGSGVIPGASG